jgi:glycosyltransferase involved in cell wall biosynthesis
MNGNVAVATNTLGACSETFVKRHIDQLNQGRTVVLCRRVEGSADLGKPFLVMGENGGAIAARGVGVLRAVWNRAKWGGIAYPSSAMDQAIARFLATQRVACVLAEFGPMGCIMQRAAAIAGAPLYVYFRGRDASALLARPGVRAAYTRLFPNVAGVIAVSRYLLDRLSASGFQHANSHVIPSGVDTDVFAPGEKDPHLVLSVGRFVPKKTPDLVVRAFAKVASEYPVRLEMIGDGPLLNPCKALAASLGVADRIRFLGAQPHEIVRERMSSARILLQHSVVGADGDAEGLPSVIQEGMAAGTVVVSTRHAGIPEAIMSGTNGFLAQEGDLAGFVQCLRQVLEYPAVADSAAARARKDAVQRFDSRSLMRRLEQIIQKPSDADEAAIG